jgi:hypothetical protein
MDVSYRRGGRFRLPAMPTRGRSLSKTCTISLLQIHQWVFLFTNLSFILQQRDKRLLLQKNIRLCYAM